MTTDPLLDFNGTIRCVSVPGFGLADTWRVTVSGLMGPVYRQDSASQLSYARPSISTFDGSGAFGALSSGNQTVRILGTQFGTVEDNAVSLVTYGTGNKYVAHDCHVVVSHQIIECRTSAGVGAQLRWSVSVGNLSSETPTTSYEPPAIVSIYGPAASEALTEGGQVVYVNGTNFGTVAESLVDFVDYWSNNNPNLILTAVNCTVIVDHVTVRCLSAPGIGYDLAWVVSIGGQASARSTVLTSYGVPQVASVSLAASLSNSRDLTLDTEGGTLLQVLGNNFGRAGDAFVNFAGKTSTSLVYVDHHQLQVRACRCISGTVFGLFYSRHHHCVRVRCCAVQFTATAGSGVTNMLYIKVYDRTSVPIPLAYSPPSIPSPSQGGLKLLSGLKNESVVLQVAGNGLGLACSSCLDAGVPALPFCTSAAHLAVQCSALACADDRLPHIVISNENTTAN